MATAGVDEPPSEGFTHPGQWADAQDAPKRMDRIACIKPFLQTNSQWAFGMELDGEATQLRAAHTSGVFFITPFLNERRHGLCKHSTKPHFVRLPMISERPLCFKFVVSKLSLFQPVLPDETTAWSTASLYRCPFNGHVPMGNNMVFGPGVYVIESTPMCPPGQPAYTFTQIS
jgi:hypothetical protein